MLGLNLHFESLYYYDIFCLKRPYGTLLTILKDYNAAPNMMINRINSTKMIAAPKPPPQLTFIFIPPLFVFSFIFYTKEENV